MMATTQDFMEFIMDSLHEVKAEIRYRKMFGEYCLYANDKPVMLICNNTPFAKMHPILAPFMGQAEIGYPYEGAKPHYIVDIDDSELAVKIVTELEKVVPLPKSKKKRIN
ncbi:MAG: transcriptional regulator [Phocaeicola sp.]